MKKLIIIAAGVMFTVFTANAQYNSRTYDNDRYSNDRSTNGRYKNDQYNDRYDNDRYDKGRNGGYGRDYGRSNGYGANRMVNSFQYEARQKIADGIVNGRITSNEAKRLLEFAERIEFKENKYMRNGRLTNREVAELKEDLMQLNRMIAIEKRDGDRSNADVNPGRNRF